MGLLYPSCSFAEPIRAAVKDGFDALEFHDEGQGEDRVAQCDLIAETGLPVLSLNVAIGPVAGCAAVPGESSVAGCAAVAGESSSAILIEPACAEKVPNCFLNPPDSARDILVEIEHPRLQVANTLRH